MTQINLRVIRDVRFDNTDQRVEPLVLLPALLPQLGNLPAVLSDLAAVFGNQPAGFSHLLSHLAAVLSHLFSYIVKLSVMEPRHLNQARDSFLQVGLRLNDRIYLVLDAFLEIGVVAHTGDYLPPLQRGQAITSRLSASRKSGRSSCDARRLLRRRGSSSRCFPRPSSSRPKG